MDVNGMTYLVKPLPLLKSFIGYLSVERPEFSLAPLEAKLIGYCRGK